MPDNPSTKTPRYSTASRILALCILSIAILWTAAMAASLRWHFLDPLVAGISNRPIGLDFFQAPCGFQNLLAGNNIFLTEICGYNLYGTPYYNHPLAAVAVGPWTVPFPPMTAFGLFVAVSLLLLAISARLLASAFENPAGKAFAYFALFCAMPTYFMLWSGQMHVFVVLAVAMILAGLMRLAREPENAERYLRWIQAGVLISLFSKPIVVLMLPALFLLPETRRKLIAPAAIYAIVSLLFLFVPRLNPGGYNAVHWLNIVRSSFSPTQIYSVTTPYELDYSGSYIVYGLPKLLLGVCNRSTAAWIVAVPLAAIAAMSLATLAFADRIHRIRAAIVTVALCVLSHFLCYFIALEYHYTTLLPLLPMLVWLRREEETQGLRWLLTAALAAVLVVLLPTPNIFSWKNPDAFWLPCALVRVVPVAIAFVTLTVYGVASTWLRAGGRLKEVWRRAASHIRGAERSGAIVGILLAGVLTAAFATAPDRLLATPSKWTDSDWNAHFEDILSRPGVRPSARFVLHRSLAISYAATDPEVALRHYAEANRVTSRHDALTVEMADVFVSRGRLVSAAKLLATLSPDKINEPKVKQRYDELRKLLKMQ